MKNIRLIVINIEILAFSEYFIENYTNRVELLKSQIDILENDIQTLSSDEYTINTRQVIRKFIFLNKIDLGNPIIEKYSNYFLAHVYGIRCLEELFELDEL